MCHVVHSFQQVNKERNEQDGEAKKILQQLKEQQQVQEKILNEQKKLVEDFKEHHEQHKKDGQSAFTVVLRSFV